jgi:hemerythrin superfamily protein
MSDHEEGDGTVGVPSGQQAAGDLVQLLESEHRKLNRIFGELLDLLDRGDLDAVRMRWGGVVRELLEHEAAEARVVWPVANRFADAANLADEHRREETLAQRLRDYDELNPVVDPPSVREVIALAREHLRAEDIDLLPRLATLDPSELRRLGEDMRQVMG